MQVTDSLSLALRTVKSNKLRTGITVTIIALGITALIGIITAIAAMNQSLKESFSTMGANSFSIRYHDRQIHLGGHRQITKTSLKNLKQKKSDNNKLITYEEAKLFKERYNFPALVSITVNGPFSVIVNDEKIKTNPNINLIGGDENYLAESGYTLTIGRNFNNIDVQSGRSICILGNSVAKKLYGDDVERAIDKIISVAGLKYRIIGVLKDKGSSAFLNADNVVITTYNNVRRIFTTDGNTYTIGIMVNDLKNMDGAIGEAKGTFRPIRKIAIDEDDNFYIDKSDSIAEYL